MSENTLGQVRYTDWDGLRLTIYDLIGWYMANLQKLERLSDYEGLTMETFVIECLNHGLETFDERYENCTRGDRL